MSVHARYEGSRSDNAAIRFEFRDTRGPVGRDLEARSRRVQSRARMLVGVRSGTLLASIRREQGVGPRGLYWDILSGVPGLTTYLMDHHDGAPPHVIRPRRRKALRFVSGGQIVFAREVHHPGNRGTRFLTRALEAAR